MDKSGKETMSKLLADWVAENEGFKEREIVIEGIVNLDPINCESSEYSE